MAQFTVYSKQFTQPSYSTHMYCQIHKCFFPAYGNIFSSRILFLFVSSLLHRSMYGLNYCPSIVLNLMEMFTSNGIPECNGNNVIFHTYGYIFFSIKFYKFYRISDKFFECCSKYRRLSSGNFRNRTLEKKSSISSVGSFQFFTKNT